MADSGTEASNDESKARRKAMRQLRSMHQAIENSDTKLVRSWLNTEGIDVNIGIDGLTAVQVAARRGNGDIYNMVFDAPGADLSVKTETGCTLLHLACERQDDNVVLVSLLLELGLDPNACENREHETPLMVALRRWRPNVCELLIRHPGTDLNVLDLRKETALFRTAQIGCSKLLRVMLQETEGSVKIDLRNNAKMTALMAAVNPWYNVIVSVLPELRRVAAKQATGDRPECVALLLKAGADPKLKDSHVRTVIEQAALYGTSPVLRCLLDTGVSPNMAGSGAVPLGHQMVKHDLNHYEELGMLIQHPNFNPKLKDKEGMSLIDVIVIEGARAILPSHGALVGDAIISRERELRYEVFIEPLIALGCPVGGRTKKYESAVKLAVEMDRPRLLQLLFKAGLNVNYEIDDRHNTVLHKVVSMELPDLVTILLDLKASKEVRNGDNLRPFEMLEFQTSRGEQVLQAFLNQQSDPPSVFVMADFLSRCIQRSRDKGVELLLHHGASMKCPGWPSPLYTWATCVVEREMLMDRLERHQRIGRLLLDTPKVNPNRAVAANGKTVVPIHAAIDNGNALLLRLLLDYKVDMRLADSNGHEAMTHVLRFPDRRLRLQMTRILVGRGYHLPVNYAQYLRWIAANTTTLICAPWPLFRLVLVTLMPRLMMPSIWRKLHRHAAQLRGALESMEVELLQEVQRAQVTMPINMVSANVMKALDLLVEVTQLPRLVDLARDAVRVRLRSVTRDRVLRLPLPPRLHSHLLLETTFQEMPVDDGLGQELESQSLTPLSEAVTGRGGLEDWPVISFLSAPLQ